jgi:hypothetical protein
MSSIRHISALAALALLQACNFTLQLSSARRALNQGAASGSPDPSAWDLWLGSLLAPNGKIYSVPRSGTDLDGTTMLRIDPLTQTISTSATSLGAVSGAFGGMALAPNGSPGSGSGDWQGAFLAPNGKIYAMSFSSSDVLVVDPSNDTIDRHRRLVGDQPRDHLVGLPQPRSVSRGPAS